MSKWFDIGGDHKLPTKKKGFVIRANFLSVDKIMIKCLTVPSQGPVPSEQQLPSHSNVGVTQVSVLEKVLKRVVALPLVSTKVKFIKFFPSS